MTQFVYCVHKVHQLNDLSLDNPKFEELMAIYAREDDANEDVKQRHELDKGNYIVLARVVRGNGVKGVYR